jgi:hypothetical protein
MNEQQLAGGLAALHVGMGLRRMVALTLPGMTGLGAFPVMTIMLARGGESLARHARPDRRVSRRQSASKNIVTDACRG